MPAKKAAAKSAKKAATTKAAAKKAAPAAKKSAAKKSSSKKAAASSAEPVIAEKIAAAPTVDEATLSSQKIAALEAELARLRGELATAPAEEKAEPAASKKASTKRSSKKAAKTAEAPTAAVAEVPEAPAAAPATPPAPEAEAVASPRAELQANLAAAAQAAKAPAAAETRGEGSRGEPRHPHQRRQPNPSSPETGDQGEGTPGEGGMRLSRRQRWKEKRMREKEERRKRREAREAGTPGAESADTAEGELGDGPRGERPPPPPLGPPEPSEGILELTPKGYGFLRTKDKQWAPLNTDCWVSGDLIRKYGMREGVYIKGEQRAGPRGPQLTEVFEVSGLKPEEIKDLPLFEELKAVNPNKRYQLETDKDRLTTRVIDMMTPVGRGQRGLIVAPPRAGKTTLLQHMAEAMTKNYPQVHLMILLVDERPEEVTEFRRVLPNAEIFASNNDQDLKSHVRISMFAIERAKRLVEAGHHVFLLMDSITRLARAFNNSHKGGATGSGGLAVGAMEIPRRLFAAARNTRTAGSLTILATALVETGSKMDDIIFLEFKGTGNMELVLDRKIAEQYIFPAVNIFRSGTRREELLLPAFQLEKIHILRRGLGGHKPIEAIQRVISLSERYPNNAQMLTELPSK